MSWIFFLFSFLFLIVVFFLLFKWYQSQQQPSLQEQFLSTEENPFQLSFSKRKKYRKIRNTTDDSKKKGASLLYWAMESVENAFKLNKEGEYLRNLKHVADPGTIRNFNEAQQELTQDFEEIKEEAEALRAGWGEKIVEQAIETLRHKYEKEAFEKHLHRMETKKKREEKKKQKQKEIEKKKLLEDEKRAQKAAQKLLEEEMRKKTKQKYS